MKLKDGQMDQKTNRRRFLRGAAAVGSGVLGLAAGCKPESPKAQETPAEPKATSQPPTAAPAPTLPDGLDENNFIVHGRSPLTAEAKRSKMGMGVITPMSVFFVRNNLPMPDASIVQQADHWKLEVKGVRNPSILTVAQLKQLGFETVTSVVQCSGNGRKFSTHGPSGSQWATGAAGCAMWTGVRISDLVKDLGGVDAGAKFMTSTGGEELPEGVDPLTVMVERSVPIEKGLDDCILAWEMNGQPIPISHGGPLRVIVPGYFGCNQIKYVKTLAFTKEETKAKIQKTGYRFRDIGEKGNPIHPSMWRMNVKSWLNGPGADDEPVLAGPVQFYGVALSGERGVEKVEYSMDGVEWKPAEFFGPDLGPNAWRTFTFTEKLPPGSYQIFTRATDTKGEVQPENRIENERAYANNAWRDHVLKVKTVAVLPKKKIVAGNSSASAGGKAKDSVALSEQGKRGKKALLGVEPNCGACHTIGDAGTAGAVGPNLDTLKPSAEMVEAAVTNGVGAMPPYRDTISKEQIADIAAYVVEATK